MQVQLGNESPIEVIDGNVGVLTGPTVTTMNVAPDATYEVAKKGTVTDVNGNEVEVTTAKELAGEIAMHLMVNNGQTSHMPGQEAAIGVVRAWANHSDKPPTWVSCDDKNFEVLLSNIFQCPIRDEEGTNG
jgi:hypothetical protein